MLGMDHAAQSLAASAAVGGPEDTLGFVPVPETRLGEEAWPDNPLGQASPLPQLTRVPDEAACWASAN